MAPNQSGHRAGAIVVSVALAAGGLMGGCTPRAASTLNTSSRVSGEILDPIISPSVLAEPVGLELRWWLAPDDQEALARVVAPYIDEPTLLDRDVVHRLARAGLRLVAIPMAELLPVRSHFGIAGRIDRRWVGVAPMWTEGMSGPRFADGQIVQVGGEIIRLRAGNLRLLVRAWSEPTINAATLRFDLAVQHVDAAQRQSDRSMFEPTAGRQAIDEGQVFRTTLAQLTADGDVFHLLLAVDPDRVWNESQPASEGESAPAPVEPNVWTPEPVVNAIMVEGPRSPRLPTLGEALLTPPATPDGRLAWRAIVVIVPRIATTTRLLP